MQESPQYFNIGLFDPSLKLLQIGLPRSLGTLGENLHRKTLLLSKAEYDSLSPLS